MTPRATVPSSSEVVEVGGGILLAVGPVVTFFSWGSWWAMAGVVLTLAGAGWLASARAVRDRNGSHRADDQAVLHDVVEEDQPVARG